MEKVQLSLERFLPELRDLERKKVFNKEEISNIVAKRRGFEVALARRDVKPADYLRYIEYENRLEKLRKVRASRIQKTTKRTLSDHSISAHVTQLHRLSVRRFPSSIPLWDAFIAHSLTLSSAILVSRTMSGAIAMHPTHVPYWIMASRWESEGDQRGSGGGNTEAARTFCMRALRFLKGSGSGEMEVWKEWIRVEVSFVERIRGRSEILGINKKPRADDEQTSVMESDKMEVDSSEKLELLDLPLNKEVEEIDEQIKAEVEEKVLSGQEAILDGAIIRVVLDNALVSFSHTVEIYETLIHSIRVMQFPLRLPVLDHLYYSLRAHISTLENSSTTAYAAGAHILALRHLEDLPLETLTVHDGTLSATSNSLGEAYVDAVGAVIDEYWSMCKAVGGSSKSRKSKKMGESLGNTAVWENFCQWLLRQEEECTDESLKAYLGSNVQLALSSAPLTPTVALLRIEHALRSKDNAKCCSVAEEATNNFGSKPLADAIREEIWAARLRVETSTTTNSRKSPSRLIFEEAVNALPFSGRLWSLFADWMEKFHKSTAENWYEESVVKGFRPEAVPPVGFKSNMTENITGATNYDNNLSPRDLLTQRYLHYLAENADPSILMEKVHALIKIPPYMSLETIGYILDWIESKESTTVFKPTALQEELFQKMINDSLAEPVHWMKYASFLLSTGHITKANEVVRKAEKAFKNAQRAEIGMRWAAICDSV